MKTKKKLNKQTNKEQQTNKTKTKTNKQTKQTQQK